jgi:hypothetical protein
VSLKKGDFNTPSVFSFLKKENGGLKFFISKPPFCAATLWPITTVLLCGVKEHQRKSYQKRADNPCACWLRVIGSASLRLAL